MRRTSIKPKKLHELAVEFLASRPGRGAGALGGRPRTYSDALILTIASIQNLHSFSFREALEYAEDFFPDIPALSTYHERLENWSPGIGEDFIEYLGKKIKKSAPETVRFFIMDGTGFSYNDLYPMQFHRGTEVRRIPSHVKIEALVGATGRRRFVLGARAGKAYASEVKLVEPLLPHIRGLGTYALGDKAYDCNRILEAIVSQGSTPAIAIKEYRDKEICHPLRLLSKENAENAKIYHNRPLIEGLFGNTKQKMTSHVRVQNQGIAMIFALLRLALLNVHCLVMMEEEKITIWLWFPNSAT